MAECNGVRRSKSSQLGSAPGVNIRFKLHFTMVDSGAVNKATDNTDAHKCRVCLVRPWDVRNNGNEICNHVHFCIELNMSLIAFGPSPCHFVIHIGNLLIDLSPSLSSVILL